MPSDPVSGRVPVAIHAPPHVQAPHLTNTLHGFDRAVAVLAGHADPDVGAMIKIHEIGDRVDEPPFDRLRLSGWIGLRVIV